MSSTTDIKIKSYFFATSILFCNVVLAQATDIPFSNTPLEIGSEPPPNVLLIVDDSSSMDWELSVEGLEGRYQVGEFLYAHVFGNGDKHFLNAHFIDSDSGLVVPTQEAADAFLALNPGHANRAKLEQVWQLRSVEFNKMFYDPSITYGYWPEVGSQVDQTRVVIDPSDPTGATVDLTNARLDFYFPQPDTFANGGYEDTAGPLNRPLLGTYQTPDATFTGNVMFYYGATQNDKTTLVPGSAEAENFANWFTFYRRRMLAAKSALSAVVNTAPDVRMGYVTINSKVGRRYDYFGNRYNVNVPIGLTGADNATIISAVKNTSAGRGGTHLRRSLDQAGRYFQCDGTGGPFDPAAACPRLAEADGGACQRNISVMVTDGYWEYDGAVTPASYNNHDGGLANDFNGGAFGDTTGQTLADVAMYYFQTDLAPLVTNSVSVNSVEATMLRDPSVKLHQHMNTFTVAFGVQSDPSMPDFLKQFDTNYRWIPPTDLNTPLLWPQPDLAGTNEARRDVKKIEDLKHAAFNGRGEYYSALNSKELARSLSQVLLSSANGAGAVSAVSFNTESQNVLYSAQFDSKKNNGDLIAYSYDTTTGVVDMASPLWRASNGLTASGQCNETHSRTMMTFDQINNQGELFTEANLAGELNANTVRWLQGLNNDEVTDCAAGTLRNRFAGDSLIGDIINSRPMFLGSPDFEGRSGGAYPTSATYSQFKNDNATRTPVVMVGTNGGMFHIFDATNGNETAAYIPSTLTQSVNNPLENITATNYSHRYYADLSPAVNDVFIEPRGQNARSWRSIAVGGFRLGEKGLFALDITAPITNSASATTSVMWEFPGSINPTDTGLVNKLTNQGYILDPPLLTMVNESHTNASQGNKWYAAFANGYNSNTGNAGLYLINIEEGYNGWSNQDVVWIEAPRSAVANGIKNGLSTIRGIDIDANGTMDLAYAGDLDGNVWRFDLRDWNNLSAQKIFTTRRRGVTQPITTQPMVMRNPENPMTYIVVVATGSWMSGDDARDTSIQSIYGFIDDPSITTPTVLEYGDLVERTLSNVYGTVTDPTTGIASAVQLRTISGADMDQSQYDGWYMDLDTSSPAGERAIRNMTMRGGYAFVNTVYPASGSCDANFGGAVMTFNPATGLLDKAIFDLNNDGQYDDNSEMYAGIVSNDGMYSNTAMSSNVLYSHITKSSGAAVVKGMKTNTDPNVRIGRVSWHQIQ